MTLTAKIDAIKSLPEVRNVRIWKGLRAYIDFTLEPRAFRGETNHVFYLDLKTGDLVDHMGKGMTRREYDAAVAAVKSALA